MEAERIPDGRMRLVLTHREFVVLIRSFIEVNTATHGDEAYLAHIGLSEAQTKSLWEEFLLLRYKKFGEPRPTHPRTGQVLWEPDEPRSTGTDWDELPEMEGKLLPDGRVELILARGELRIFRNLVISMLDALHWDESEMVVRVREMSVGDAEAMANQFERLEWEMPNDAPRNPSLE